MFRLLSRSKHEKVQSGYYKKPWPISKEPTDHACLTFPGLQKSVISDNYKLLKVLTSCTLISLILS